MDGLSTINEMKRHTRNGNCFLELADASEEEPMPSVVDVGWERILRFPSTQPTQTLYLLLPLLKLSRVARSHVCFPILELPQGHHAIGKALARQVGQLDKLHFGWPPNAPKTGWRFRKNLQSIFLKVGIEWRLFSRIDIGERQAGTGSEAHRTFKL